MNLYQWYMQQAEMWAAAAGWIRSGELPVYYPGHAIRMAQDKSATYVTLAEQAAARYGR